MVHAVPQHRTVWGGLAGKGGGSWGRAARTTEFCRCEVEG